MNDASPHAKHNTHIDPCASASLYKMKSAQYEIHYLEKLPFVFLDMMSLRFTQKQKLKFHLFNNISFQKAINEVLEET